MVDESDNQPNLPSDKADQPSNDSPMSGVNGAALRTDHQDDGQSGVANGPKANPEPAKINRLAQLKQQLGEFIGSGWRRRLILGGAGVAVIAIIGLVPALRYAVVGLVYHSSADLTVQDSETHQPVSYADINWAGVSGTTDNQGHVTLTGLNLGQQALAVVKKGYNSYRQTQTVTIGHRQITINLKSSGIKVAFSVTDKISGQPLDGVDVTVGDIRGTTMNGHVTLSLLPGAANPSVALSKTGFNGATTTIKIIPGQFYQLTLVPAGHAYYLSNRKGTIDLYTSNLDGSNATVVLPGDGNEDSQTGVLPSIDHPDWLALASSRGGRDANGDLVHALYLFNAGNRQLTKIDSPVDPGYYRAWVGGYLIYEKAVTGPPYGCYNIYAYSPDNQKSTALVTSNSGLCAQATIALDNGVFYSVTGGSADQSGLYVIQPGGQGQKRLNSVPADNVSRQVKNTILYEYYSPSESWYNLNLSNLSVTHLSVGPSLENNRAYADSPDGQHSVFIEERDGRTELYVTDGQGGNERKLTDMGDVNQFVQWIGNDYVLFSATKSDENALYVVALAGGQPQKVTDFYRGNSRTYGGGYNPAY